MGLIACFVLRIAAGKVQPKDMNTIALMFATAQRVGKPRK
jgi:hypothetical protein